MGLSFSRPCALQSHRDGWLLLWCSRTLARSRAWKRERSGRCKASAAVLGSAGCTPWGRGCGTAHHATPTPACAPCCPCHAPALLPCARLAYHLVGPEEERRRDRHAERLRRL